MKCFKRLSLARINFLDQIGVQYMYVGTKFQVKGYSSSRNWYSKCVGTCTKAAEAVAAP